MSKVLFLLLITIVFAVSCNNNEEVQLEETFVENFYSRAKKLNLQVGYEIGAEPYINFGGKDAWDITHDNVLDLLSPKSIDLVTPVELNQMTNLGELEQNNYTRENVIDISKNLQRFDDGEEQGMTILFLDGYFIVNGSVNDRVLGVNLDKSGTIAIFKPVVVNAGSSQLERTLVEQTTVVHEIGHALGLVNNGVEATSDHHDDQNGAHCTNEDCVMYWENGGAGISDFIQPYILGGEIDLFKEQCKADISTK